MEVDTRAGHYIEFLRYIDVFSNEIYYVSIVYIEKIYVNN